MISAQDALAESEARIEAQLARMNELVEKSQDKSVRVFSVFFLCFFSSGLKIW